MTRAIPTEAEEGTIGNVPSFGFPAGFISGPGPQSLPPSISGNNDSGVPGIDQLAGQQAGGLAAVKAYGESKVGASPSNQPLFWLFIFFIAGVAMIANFTHFSLKHA